MGQSTAPGSDTASIPALAEAESMPVFVAMRKRRMHRAFSQQPVPAEVTSQLLWGAQRAATARAGIRLFVLVDDPARMRTIRQACPGFVNDAPMAVAICTDLRAAEAVGGRSGIEEVGRIDAGAAAAHIALAGPALGLGVCVVTSWTAGAVRTILELPEHVRPDVLVAIGYPSEVPSPAAKAPPQQIYHNTFGLAWRPPA
jgi:nitroreductase